MQKTVVKVLVLFLLSSGICHALETSEELYLKAETLYNSIPDKTQSIQNIPKYKEITDLLEQVVVINREDEQLLQKTYFLMIDSYDMQARYPQKQNAMKQYAMLKYPEDKEQQARWLKQQADKLLEQGETAEAIAIYRITTREYPETLFPAEISLLLGQLMTQQIDYRAAIEEYQYALDKKKLGVLKEEILLRLAYIYKRVNNSEKAIEIYQKLLVQFSETAVSREETFYELADAYYRLGNKIKTQGIINEYLNEYPNGKYQWITERFLYNNDL